MKFQMIIAYVFIFSLSASALGQSDEFYEQAIIESIDDFDPPSKSLDVSEVALPSTHYSRLLQLMRSFRFTPLSETYVSNIFAQLKRDPRARMRNPGGDCSTRRAYIQGLLRRSNIVSGKLLLYCPQNNGRLRVRDQVSGQNYTYSNHHDVNIVAVGNSFRVLDVQFENGPVSLHQYLSAIESAQKIHPYQRMGNSNGRGYCHWYISTHYLTY